MKYVIMLLVAAGCWLSGCKSTVSRLQLETVDLGDGQYSAFYVNKEEVLPKFIPEADKAKPAFTWALLSDEFQLFPVNTLERYTGREGLTPVRLIQNYATTSQQIKLTDGRYVLANPVFQVSYAQLSPSGNHVSFSCRLSPGAPWTVWLIGRNGDEPRLLAFGKDPSWKDDETLVYSSKIDGRWNLVQSSVNGSHRRVLVSEPGDCVQPQVSPDGSRLAYVTRHPTSMESQIWVCSSNGEAPKKLTRYPGLDDSPVWAEDGNAVYFRSTRGGDWGAWKIRID